MPSFYKDKNNIKSNAGYVEDYQMKSCGRYGVDDCQVCSYCGETVFDCYLCAKNPYILTRVSYKGHCGCFTREEIKLSKLQQFVLNLKLFRFKFPSKVK